MTLIGNIKNKFTSVFKKKASDIPPKIFDLGYSPLRKKRVLVSYLNDCYLTSILNHNFSTNRTEAHTIATIFLELGYIVDLVDCRDNTSNFDNEYDVIFGFGFPFRKWLGNANILPILYLTEAPPDLSYSRELTRVTSFNSGANQRNEKITRSGTYYKTSDIEVTGTVICLGEGNKAWLRKNYPDKTVIAISPTGIYNSTFDSNFTAPKRNFLCLTSRGWVHKGIDIIVNYFDSNECNPDNHTLFLAGSGSKNEFRLLKHKKNIVFLGQIDIKSAMYLDVLKQVSFIVSCSCSEGMSTSVLTGMLHGLIPIVTEESNINSPYKIPIAGFDLSDFVQSIHIALKLSDTELEKYKGEIYEHAHDNYKLNNFYEAVKKSITTIINNS
jgi:glycosyltransferase involved in cell wall biosynthesis